MASTAMTGPQLVNNTEIVEKKVDVESALARMRRPLDMTTVTIDVYGVYALPDQWKTKIDDPNEQLYQYELDVFGMSLKQAKVFPRELTEEEKAELEAAKNAKGKQPPPKDPKKKEEEPSKEEIERIEREKREKEERERKAREEWEALDELTKFYVKSEDIYKEPCIKFHNQWAQKRIELLHQQLQQTPESDEQLRKEIQEQISDCQRNIYVGNSAVDKQSFELVELEEFVSHDKGCWIKFSKLPPPEEEILDPKAVAAKKAPPKGAKGGSTEDMKPFFGKAWLSLEDLLKQGATETKQRVYLKTCPPLIKKAGDDGVERYVQADEYDNVFETNQTYIYIKVTLSAPVTPEIPESPEPLPHEVVPVKQFIRWPFSKDPTDDFKKQITLAVESLAKEYYTMFQNDLETEARGQKHENEVADSIEERKKEFLYEINTSGKYHILKEKLKKTIVRIVKEHFKKTGSIKGLYKDDRDHFYSQLYAYLVSQMRETVQQMVERKRNELHENITVPQDQFVKERDFQVERVTQENLAQRYLRLASEYENLYGNLNEAESFIQKYIAMYEGDPEKMLEMGKFYLRIGKLEKADEFLRDAYSFQIKNQLLAFNYACFLLQLGTRNKEALVILNKLSLDKYEEVKVNILISIAYEQDSDPIMASKYKAIAFIKRLRELNIISEAGDQASHEPVAQPPIKLQPGQADLIKQQQQQLYEQMDSNKVKGSNAYKNQRLDITQQDGIFLDLAEQLTKENLCFVAHLVINNVQTTNTRRYFQCLGDILMQKKSFEEAIQPFTQILVLEPTNINSLEKLGHCYYFSGRDKEAEESYIRAIRISNLTPQNIEDPYVKQRLGAIYIRQQRYLMAFETFLECHRLYQNSFTGFNLAVSQIKSETADWFTNQLLEQLNELDPYKAEVWGYAVINSLRLNEYIKAFQCMKEAFKLKLSDVDLLFLMSKKFKVYNKFSWARDCIEQALRARAQKDTMRHQKKLEEFFKAVKPIAVRQGTKTDELVKQHEEEFKAKFKETLVKSNCLKEDDEIIKEYITLQVDFWEDF